MAAAPRTTFCQNSNCGLSSQQVDLAPAGDGDSLVYCPRHRQDVQHANRLPEGALRAAQIKRALDGIGNGVTTLGAPVDPQAIVDALMDLNALLAGRLDQAAFDLAAAKQEVSTDAYGITYTTFIRDIVALIENAK